MTNNPLIRYKAYHKESTNILIHQCCVPVLVMSFYSIVPLYMSIVTNLIYSVTYLLFDLFSSKSVHSVYYMQTIFLFHFILRNCFSLPVNLLVHIVSWALQIIGHGWYEKNTPAFLDYLLDSFLFAPYFTFLETFYPSSFEIKKDKYMILDAHQGKIDHSMTNVAIDSDKKTILYFAGLFQKSEIEYKEISKDLGDAFNHVYVNFHFNNHDVYRNTLEKIMDDLGDFDMECVIGFSFGGALALQFKHLYSEKYGKKLKTILISPGGFECYSMFEKGVQMISGFLYPFFGNDKWFMIHQYPKYQNTFSLEKDDFLIGSTSDMIHPCCSHPLHTDANTLRLKHASHMNMISVVKKQAIIKQLLQNNYQMEKVNTKPLTSSFHQFIFGGHFYPYHVSLWSGVSLYHFYSFVRNGYSFVSFFYGFLLASSLWTFTEYMFHRYLLHNLLYVHHKKHHVYPNKLSIINTPMSMVILTWIMYYFLWVNHLNPQILSSYYIFFPLNYLSFEFIHLLSHSYKGKNLIVLNAKYYHKLHHIDDKVNYSFITPFWDYFLGTLSPKYETHWTELLFGFVPFYSFMIHQRNE